MTKIFSIFLMNAVFIVFNAYSMNKAPNINVQEDYEQTNARLDQIKSEFEETQAQTNREFIEIMSNKAQIINILIQKMNSENADPEQVLKSICEFNAATSEQQIVELAQKHSHRVKRSKKIKKK
jgi:hypothetical protein